MAEAENLENEKEYFTRVHLALTECGTEVLCKLLLKKVKELTPKDHPSMPWSLDEFLHYKKKEILSAIGKDRSKEDIIYPYKRDTDLQKWDISLFVHVILTACDFDANDQIHRQLKHDICNLRDLRNKVCHKQTHKLTKAIYQFYYGRMQGSVIRICEYMQEPNLQDFFQRKLDQYECLGHVYVNGLFTENHKSEEVIHEGDGTVESSLQQIKSIIQQKGLTVNIPAVDVMLVLQNYNKDNEQAVSEILHALFSEALLKENILETSETLHCVDFRADLKNEVLSLVRKLFQEKRTIARVSTGCLILTIQCPDLDSVISLIQDSISGRLTDLFASLEEVMRTDPSNDSFDVYAGITKQSCWSLLNTLFCDVSKACSYNSFTIESLIQNEGVSIRILKFLGSVHEKEEIMERILSNENNKIRMQLTEKLKQYISQPRLEMQCLPHERKGEAFRHKDVETSFLTQHDDEFQQALNESFEIDRLMETNAVPEDRWRLLRSPSCMASSDGGVEELTTGSASGQKTFDLKTRFPEKDSSSHPPHTYPKTPLHFESETTEVSKSLHMKLQRQKDEMKQELEQLAILPDTLDLELERLLIQEQTALLYAADQDLPCVKSLTDPEISSWNKDKEMKEIRAIKVKSKYEPDSVKFKEDQTEPTDAPTLKKLREMELLETDGHGEYGSTSGMAVVWDRFLLATDFDKECLRCFDMDSGKQQGWWYDSRCQPCGITTIPGNRVAVTSCIEVWFLRVTEKGDLLFENIINVKKYCDGIASSGDNLIVCYEYPDPGVQILDMKGNVIKEFEMDDDGQKLFVSPRSLAVSPDHSTIYIVDNIKNTVTSLTQDGRVLDVVDIKEYLWYKSAITVDSAGRLYVCGYDTVFLMSPETRTVIPLLEIKDWIRHPSSVAVCDKTQRLYVASMDSMVIKEFEMPKHTTA